MPPPESLPVVERPRRRLPRWLKRPMPEPGMLMTEGILTDQYVQTLRSDRVNLVVKAYFNSQEFLILAGRNSDAPFLDLDEVDKFLLAADDGIRLPPNPSARCGPYTVVDE